MTRSEPLVLSLFPGIGLLDMAFEEAGFCVVRGPDLLWGGDIRRFHPPKGKFEGVIGGPPCQRFSGLGRINVKRWGDESVMPDMIPDFSRCISEARPEWFVMENVTTAPAPEVAGYHMSDHVLDNLWCGGEQRRRRRFTFGMRGALLALRVRTVALRAFDEKPTVISSGQAGHGGSRATIAAMAEAQGIDPLRFSNTPFTTTELRRAIANGVPLPMGRAIARAVKDALYNSDNPLFGDVA